MNALLFERPIRFATGPLLVNEEAQDMEDFTYHRPVLATETIELLAPRPGSLILDGTCGGGGHTEAILLTGADVLALDQDPDALAFAAARLTNFGDRVTLRRANFREAGRVLDELGIAQIGGALLDLGVSSRQLENADRGFSLMRNGPLDMRMDPRRELTAAEVVNSYAEEELTNIFREFGEEPAARRIASQIVKLRKETPFRETLSLAKAIEKIVGRHGRRHPATQVFQALRMEVNDELRALEEGLRGPDESSRIQQPDRGHYLSFPRGSDREKLLPRPQPRMARPAGMARAAAQSRFFTAPHHAEAGRARRDRATGQPALAQRQAAGGGKDLMNRHRRKNFNPIDAPSLARWIVITAFLATTGLSYVYLTVQLHHQGVQKKMLEQELIATRAQNEDAKVQFAALTSRTALQRRLKEGYLKMIPITEQNIVRLNSSARPAGEDELQPVVNKQERPMKWNSRTRCAIVCVFFALLFSVFSYRLIYLQMVMHKYYTKLAAEKNIGRNVIRAERGAIYDAHDEVLAQNVPVATIVADGTLINGRAALIPFSPTSLHVPPNEIAEKIASRRPYIVLKRELPGRGRPGSRENLAGEEPARRSLRTRNGPGLSQRADALPCHRLRGFSAARHPGCGSVDGSICGGRTVIATSSTTRRAVKSCLYRGLEHAPRNGCQVHLTIDMGICKR